LAFGAISTEGHFRLVAALGDPGKAYEVLERARGRAAADVLRAPAGAGARPSAEAAAQTRSISLLQIRLLRARRRAQTDSRSAVGGGAALDRLRRHVWPLHRGRTAVSIQRVQQQLSPDEVILEYVLSDPRSYCGARANFCPLTPGKKARLLLSHNFLHWSRFTTVT
jgi:hypothetical protein